MIDIVNNECVLQDLGFGASKQGETWERVTQIRDKFEYDRERRMRERGKYVLILNCFFLVIVVCLQDIAKYQVLPPLPLVA